MNNNEFDFIIEAEKIRKVTIEKMKKESEISAKEDEQRRKNSEESIAKTRNAALDLMSWRD